MFESLIKFIQQNYFFLIKTLFKTKFIDKKNDKNMFIARLLLHHFWFLNRNRNWRKIRVLHRQYSENFQIFNKL